MKCPAPSPCGREHEAERRDVGSRPIGVFDSGVGGLSVLQALRAQLPWQDFIYLSDAAHAPYGERGDAYVVQRSLAVADELINRHGVKALVVACNTATAAAVHLLRDAWPALPLVGVEPALKPAVALTSTRRIAVFATRGTLASAKFAALHASLRSQAEFVLQPCDGLAAAIELGDTARVSALCERYVGSVGTFGVEAGQFDTLVLGCTHYPFAREQFTALLGPQVNLVDTGAPVARQTRRLLEADGLLSKAATAGSVRLLTTGSLAALQAAAVRWLDLEPASAVHAALPMT